MRLRQRIAELWADYVLALGEGRRELPGVFMRMLLLSLLELTGVALLAPFVGIILGRDFTVVGLHFELKTESGRELFAILSFGIVAVYLVRALIGYRFQQVISGFSERRRHALLVSLMSAFMLRPYVFHLGQNSVELFNRAYLGATDYATGIMAASLRLIADLTIALPIVILLLIRDPFAVLLLISLMGGVFLITHSTVRKRYAADLATFLQANGKLWTIMLQSMQAVKEIKVLGREAYFIQRMKQDAHLMVNASARTQAYGLVPKLAIETSTILFLVLFTWVTVRFRGDYDLVASLGFLAVAAVRLMPIGSTILQSINSIRAYRPRLTMLCGELRAVQGQPLETPAAVGAVSEFESLQLSNLCYRYPGQATDTIQDVNLRIQKGQIVGLMGKSGAGKSTLADVIMGLMDPSHGTIAVNGLDVREHKRAWQQRVAYIPQAIFILDDSVLHNIALGVADAEIDMARVQLALAKSQLTEVVSKLPDGLHTSLGERGVRLSGGQRQRIAIARALYHDREFLIMDEATSALDEETEREVIAAMGALKGEKTILVIAHKANILKHANAIYHVENGRLQSGMPQYVQD